jgi:predicted RNase H-like HicB family nuclease
MSEKGGGYHAFCPALKGCHTQGNTVEETRAKAQEAIELYLKDLLAEGEPIPVDNCIITWVNVDS